MADKDFTFVSSTISDGGFRFVLSADENNDRTIFYPGSSARLKLYPGGKKPEITLSSGSSSVYGEGYVQSVTEFIAFKQSDSATLSYPLVSLTSASWTGIGDGQPVFSGRSVSLPAATTGVMKIEYDTSYDILDVVAEEAVYMLVNAEKDGLSGYYVVDFTDGYDTGTSERTVILTVKDACTRQLVSGAHVYINDRYSGMSDSGGRVRLGSMKLGTYSLKIVKDGYQSTDEDSVCNDYFTVD